MTEKWKETPAPKLEQLPEKQFTAERRAAVSAQFPGDRLIVEAGEMKTRSNDTDYKFRPFTPFTYYTGLGMDYEPGAVLVFEPLKLPKAVRNTGARKDNDSKFTHTVTLYIEPMHGRTDSEFYTSASRGEFWVGRRPDMQAFEEATGIKVAPKSELKAALKKLLPPTKRTRLLSETEADGKFDEFCSEQRLVKDAWEIREIKAAVEATKNGFEAVIRNFPRATNKPRGERVVEGIFNATAVAEGNSVGYETIAAAGEHATTLHWIRNTGSLNPGELLLLDAGVEVDSLYTADITRTLPISGEFNFWQRQIYNVVLEAADAAFKAAKPGNKFSDVHNAAMEVLAHRLFELKIMKVTPEEALKPVAEGGKPYFRRWMCHGTSHHLGLDVHDCAHARESEYRDGVIKPGMVFTIEPGLYFKSDDDAVPNEYKGIGIRIEDDIMITKNGAKNLSKDIPRNPEHVESWIKLLQNPTVAG
jgi:Xaa-Pro aminopeptidase